jgi:uncharacterized protein YjbJ (UPF0337 family)
LGAVGIVGCAHVFSGDRRPGAFEPGQIRRVGDTTNPFAMEQRMNWDRIEGNWKQFKGKAQQQWGKLTDDDLDVVEGKRTELAGRLQQRYGYAKDQAEKEIDSWLNNVS